MYWAKIKSSPIGKAAGGYIPNFAGGLGDAIARESAAGLPINQIRINQDPSLKNSGNPMGLAVTNTRDEPTGAIPNFARGKRRRAAERAAQRPGLPITPVAPAQLPQATINQIGDLGDSAGAASKRQQGYARNYLCCSSWNDCSIGSYRRS